MGGSPGPPKHTGRSQLGSIQQRERLKPGKGISESSEGISRLGLKQEMMMTLDQGCTLPDQVWMKVGLEALISTQNAAV